jgi:hypothetical protein
MYPTRSFFREKPSKIPFEVKTRLKEYHQGGIPDGKTGISHDQRIFHLWLSP